MPREIARTSTTEGTPEDREPAASGVGARSRRGDRALWKSRHLSPTAAAVLSVAALAFVGAWSLLGAARATARTAAARKQTPAEKEARAFLEAVTPLLAAVARVEAETSWMAATDASPEHAANRAGAARAAAAAGGAPSIIERSRSLLAHEKDLDPLTARQLRQLLLSAAEAPATTPALVARRSEAEARQTAVLETFTYCLQPRPPGRPCARPLGANQVDAVLQGSRDLGERQRAWVASMDLGTSLKTGLIDLQKLRNQIAREMGHASYFALQVADYGMTVDELMTLLDATLAATEPLYRELHCWARHTLARRFGKPVPRFLPAHWVGSRWAQRWPGLVDTAMDSYFKGSNPETIVSSAERFYTSLGFAALPESFWKRSDLYPVRGGTGRRKAPHGSVWHLDLEQDVRVSLNVEATEQSFGAAHHALGHAYYDLAYARPEVPLLLRRGANRAFHEAIGELARLASAQPAYLRTIGVLPPGVEPQAHPTLLRSALDTLVLLRFAAGTMAHFEHDLYEGEAPPADWQKRWWEHATRFQGVVPPLPRPDGGCDACSKPHLSDDPARYYDHAISTLLSFQLHQHICAGILKQDVHACDYSGHKEVGDFLRGILSLGATRDWREVIEEATGEKLGPRALVAFYAPLAEELAKQNVGRTCAWED